MLVLARQQSEVICIGDDIKIMVVQIRGDQVRLGIEAPKTVLIMREEIQDRGGRISDSFEDERKGKKHE